MLAGYLAIDHVLRRIACWRWAFDVFGRAMGSTGSGYRPTYAGCEVRSEIRGREGPSTHQTPYSGWSSHSWDRSALQARDEGFVGVNGHPPFLTR
jgi:hypothetical protein